MVCGDLRLEYFICFFLLRISKYLRSLIYFTCNQVDIERTITET